MLEFSVKVCHKGNSSSWSGNISIPPGFTGLQLKDQIQNASGLPIISQKVLYSGKFLKDCPTLVDQRVKSGKLMIIISEEHSNVRPLESEQNLIDVEHLTQAACELSSRPANERTKNSHSTNPRFELVNQGGSKIQLSERDEKSLKIGMALYEKGKACLKLSDYKSALALFYEADKSFSECSSEILKYIDNHGLLYLDIVWCYFKMKDSSFLKEAEWRLAKATECLERCHGKNFERLFAVKGTIGPDMVHWCRLHLLRGIVAFHREKFELANSFFDNAEALLGQMHLRSEDLARLCSMGFTERESRLALRASAQNIENAVSRIVNARAQREQRNAARKELESMGFSSTAVVDALMETQWNMKSALELLLSRETLSVRTILSSENQETNHRIESSLKDMEAFATNNTTTRDSSEIGEDSKNPLQMEAEKELMELIDQDEEAYLDISLEEEELVVNEYKAMLVTRLSTEK